jgi:hypothetical protein
MKKNISILFITILISVFLIGCVDKCNITKPEPTIEELFFFKLLEKKYKCKIDRVANEHITISDKDRSCAYYSLILRDSKVLKYDEEVLRLIGSQIAEELHKNVLKKNYNYAYNELIIGFDIKSNDQYEFYFDYKN